MAQYIPDATTGYEADLDNLIQALKGNTILSGGAVTAQSSPNMTVQIAQAYVRVAGNVQIPPAISSQTIAAADPTNARIDVVSENVGAGTFRVTTGTASTTPKPPSLPNGDILLAYVSVAAGAVNVQNSNISDRRLIVGDGVWAGSTGTVGTNTPAGSISQDTDTGEFSRYDGSTWKHLTNRYPNLVLNSDFSRRNAFSQVLIECFPDTNGYLDSNAATVGGGVITFNAANEVLVWPKSHPANFWRDGRASATFKATDTTKAYELWTRYVDANNLVRCYVDGTGNFVLAKVIAGSVTNIATTPQAITLNNWYWLEIEMQGTTVIAKIYNTGGAAAGVTKAASTLLLTLTGTVADAAVVAGDVAIRSSNAAANWGGFAGGLGGVYFETWMPESWGLTFPGSLGGQAIGFDESADAGPLGKQWAIRGYIPHATRQIVFQHLGATGGMAPSTSYTGSVYMKVSGKGGSGQLLEAVHYGFDAVLGNPDAHADLLDAGETVWTRKSATKVSATTTRRTVQTFYFNSPFTATGTGYYMLPQMEQGSAVSAWRNAPADDAPITWGLGATGTLATTASGTFVEIDARDLAGNLFLPWDARVAIQLVYSGANNGAGNAAATGYLFDGSNVGPGGRAHSPVAGYNFMVSFMDMRLASAGKHRVSGLHQTSGGILSPGVGTATSLFVTATRGK